MSGICRMSAETVIIACYVDEAVVLFSDPLKDSRKNVTPCRAVNVKLYCHLFLHSANYTTIQILIVCKLTLILFDICLIVIV